MDDVTVWGNRLEAGLWWVVAVALAIGACRVPRRERFLWGLQAFVFAVYGLSDLIESYTGAWWQPWWLLVMKGACIVTFVLAMVGYWRLKNTEKKTAKEVDPR